MMKLPLNFKTNKQQTLIMTVLLGVLIVIVYFNFILIPQVKRVITVIVKTDKIRADVKNAKADIAKTDELKANMDAFKDKVESYEKMLPAEQEIPSLLENLSAMAKSSDVKILGITPAVQSEEKAKDKKAAKDTIYQETPILISARSGYHEVGKFLADLENSDRFMKVADIEIRANKSSPKRHDVELLVLTYVLLKGK